MELKAENETRQSARANLDKKLELTKDSGVFGALSGDYEIERIYFSYFQDLPSKLNFIHVDSKDFLGKFKQDFGKHILKEINEKSYSGKKQVLNNHWFIVTEQILVQVKGDDVTLLHTNPKGEILQGIRNLISDYYVKEKKKPEICVIISSSGYLSTQSIEFKKPEIDFQNNYCDDFIPVHEKTMQLLKKQKESGLFLFHGKPGTGKSTYLRYLIKSINKKTIFISPKMAGNLDSIEITKLLLDNKNCILVIEDAEGLVVSRNHEHNSNLSTILNLTDGILGESLGIQIIATFNTDLTNIDSALMRKGRLKVSYEFTELPASKASKIISKQGVEVVVNHPMTIADAYHYDASNLDASRSNKPMGFVQ